MFNIFKKKSESTEVKELTDKVQALETKLKRSEEQVDYYRKDSSRRQEKLNDALDEIELLKEKLKAEEDSSSVSVKYASARKTMNKTKLKEMRKALEAVPGGASGFRGTVSVYNKKNKKLSLVELKSKDQALDVLSQAEKGDIEIVV